MSDLKHNPSVSWAFICKHAFLDADGLPCVISAFDTLKNKTYPTIGVKISVIATFEIQTKAFNEFQVSIWDKSSGTFSGPPIFSSEPLNVSIEKPGEYHFIETLANVIFPNPGTYEVAILVNGIPEKSLNLSVVEDSTIHYTIPYQFKRSSQ